ncbi:unnamed protein product, partial [Rotaria sp. Silwood2]
LPKVRHGDSAISSVLTTSNILPHDRPPGCHLELQLQYFIVRFQIMYVQRGCLCSHCRRRHFDFSG